MDCFSEIKNRYQKKKVLILGLGIQSGGLEALLFFQKLKAELCISDLREESILAPTMQKIPHLKSIPVEYKKHSEEFIRWADVIVRNPGVPWQHPALVLARQLKKEIIMPSSFFLKYCHFHSIGITGTRGKSTTTNLIYEILKQHAKTPTYLAGNLPQYSPFKLIPTIQAKHNVVLELSSWELQGCEEQKVSPQLAILTNVYPDHLNYYNSMNEYFHDKMQITANQQENDIFLTLKSTYSRWPEAKKYIKGHLELVDDHYFQGNFAHLIGKHNQANASLALRAAELLGIDTNLAHSIICEFKGLPFRLEFIGTLSGAKVYNDSTSTTPIAGIKALETLSTSFPEKKILAVIGGNEKKLPYTDWLEKVNLIADKIFLLPGSLSTQIKPLLMTSKLTEAKDLTELFAKIKPDLNSQSIMLFSPAATSFAGFKNEFDRGQQFNQHYSEFKSKYGA